MIFELPDGSKKEFQLSKKGREVCNVLLSSNQGQTWNEVKVEFNKYKNTIVFAQAPLKDDLILINTIAFNTMNYK